MTAIPTVDFRRLRNDIEALAAIGRSEDHALYREAFSPAWVEACDWLMQRLTEAGLTARRDEALNVVGRLEAGEGASVMTGSHLDSVPGGGHLDGALGVVAGLECLRRLKELCVDARRPLELVAFSDEEGRFGGMFGSQAIAGKLTPEAILAATDATGVSLSSELTRLGVEPLRALRAQRRSNSVHCYVELHIEQGPVLDVKGLNVGAVSAIVGLRRWQARLIGQSNHAGTTPMAMRKDAFQGLADVSLRIPEVIRESGSPHSVITIGRVELSPGAANVIPGRADFSVDIRDVDREGLEKLTQSFREMASEVARSRDLMFEFESISDIEPVRCDSEIVDLIRSAARQLGHDSVTLPSGAAHDAQVMAALTKVGMLFVPSAAGRSHSAAEWTSWESIEAGANTLLNVLYRLVVEP